MALKDGHGGTKTDARSAAGTAGNGADGMEPQPRYFLARRLVGVATPREYLQTGLHGALLFGGPPLAARILARLGKRQALHRLEQWWARSVLRALRVRLDLDGIEHVDPRATYVVAALHEGFPDALALLQLPLRMRFAVRDELYEWRVLGPYLRDTGHIRVSPEKGRRSYRRLLREARAVVAAGESVAIFPQGTILGIETDFLGGAFALARALDCPILPVAISGTHRVWEHPYTPRLRFGEHVSLRVLPPIRIEHAGRAHLDSIRIAVRRQLKAAAFEGSMAAPRHFVPARDGYWDGYAYQIDPDFPELAAEIECHRRSAINLCRATYGSIEPNQRKPGVDRSTARQ